MWVVVKGFGRVGGVVRPGMVRGCCDGDDILVRNVLRIIRDEAGQVWGECDECKEREGEGEKC